MNTPATHQPQFDDCIDANAPASLTARATYDGGGDFTPGLVDRNVSCSSCTSSVTLLPSTSTHFSASDLTVTPPTGTSKTDLGDGEISVSFSHPSANCSQNVWQLAFSSGGLTTPLVVKIRKTRIDPSSDDKSPSGAPQ